jgi:hypothetical protein
MSKTRAWRDLPTAAMATLDMATERREAAGAAALIAMCAAEDECDRLRVSLGAAVRTAVRRVGTKAAAAVGRLEPGLRDAVAEMARAVALSENINGLFRAKMNPQSPL